MTQKRKTRVDKRREKANKNVKSEGEENANPITLMKKMRTD